MGNYAKAGCENPAKSSTSEVLTRRSSMPGVQMPGDHTRKVSSGKAGQDTAGEARQVQIAFGKKSPGKQTWKGAADGYTNKSIPEYTSSPGKTMGSESKGSASQRVKGSDGKRSSDAKSVAGRSAVSR